MPYFLRKKNHPLLKKYKSRRILPSLLEGIKNQQEFPHTCGEGTDASEVTNPLVYGFHSVTSSSAAAARRDPSGENAPANICLCLLIKDTTYFVKIKTRSDVQIQCTRL